MRTTVDLDDGMLARARKRALEERRTLSAVVADALAAYLAAKRTDVEQPGFELLVRGRPGARFPTPADLSAVEEEEDAAAIALPKRSRRAAP